jgi:hypothetical protein
MSSFDKRACTPTWALTEALNTGQPKEVTPDRVDMTHEIMDKHYDKATKNEQMECREEFLRDV